MTMAKHTAGAPRRRGVIADTDNLHLHKGKREQEEGSRKRHHPGRTSTPAPPKPRTAKPGMKPSSSRYRHLHRLIHDFRLFLVYVRAFKASCAIRTFLTSIFIRFSSSPIQNSLFLSPPAFRFTGGNRGRKGDHMEGIRYVPSMG